MTDKERAALEKEIMGLTARLKWDHVGEGIKETWRMRIEDIRIRLATERTSGQ